MRVVLVALVLVLTGCGLSDDPGSRPPPAMAEPRYVESVCPATTMPGLDGPAAGTAIPDDFEVTSVLRCDGGLAEHAGEATELVAELRRPSDRLTNGICPTNLITPPYLFLVDVTGRAVHPAFPTDACGQPRESARDAVAALDWTQLTR